MPEVSRFFGIVITMYHGDHAPPHFHARYAGRKAIVSIDPVEVLYGRLPPRVLGLVVEWATIHQVDSMENWRLARGLAPLNRIIPLD
jgi:hypothetical protein